VLPKSRFARYSVLRNVCVRPALQPAFVDNGVLAYRLVSRIFRHRLEGIQVVSETLTGCSLWNRVFYPLMSGEKFMTLTLSQYFGQNLSRFWASNPDSTVDRILLSKSGAKPGSFHSRFRQWVLSLAGFSYRKLKFLKSETAHSPRCIKYQNLEWNSPGGKANFEKIAWSWNCKPWKPCGAVQKTVRTIAIEELDGWLRRRIRMCYRKQWRRPRRRIANLLKLGTSKRHAILTGISRKGYWRLSKIQHF